MLNRRGSQYAKRLKKAVEAARKRQPIMTNPSGKPQPQSRQEVLAKMPAAEMVQRKLASAKSLDDFFVLPV